MAEAMSIQVNFGRPMPLLPLDTVALLPQQILPLHVFEPRYRQLVEDVLDGAGQLAMAVFEGTRWKQEYHGRPPIRPAVCVGQIMQHERLDDGRYNLLVQGVCRARIACELPPSEGRLYRVAMLEPVGLGESEAELEPVRQRLDALLSEGPLTQLRVAKLLLERVRNEQIPPAALLELVGFTVLTDPEVRYRLLEDGDPQHRAEIVERELMELRELIRRAGSQRPQDWPKGCSWN